MTEILSFIEWISQMQKNAEDELAKEKLIYDETKYLEGFLQALEIARVRYLMDHGVETLKPKVYE